MVFVPFSGRKIRAKFRGWQTLTTAHRGINRGIVSYLANHGVNTNPDHPDLAAGVRGELAWNAVGGQANVLETLGDVARVDESTQYFSYVPSAGFPAGLLPMPGAPWTILWCGHWRLITGTLGIAGWGNASGTNYIAIYNANQELAIIEQTGGLNRFNTYVNLNPADDELVVIIARGEAERTSASVEGITEFGFDQKVLTPAATPDISAFTVNAMVILGTPGFIGKTDTYVAGVWNRWLSETEVRQLTEDPFLPMRPHGAYLGDTAAHLELARNPLRCPGFPVTRTTEHPHDQTDGEGGTIILASHAPRIVNQVIDVDFSTLTKAEQIELEFAYDEGRGLANPFTFTIPGDTGPSSVIFERPFRMTHRSAQHAEAQVRLRIVNPADWLPSPGVIFAKDAQGTSVDLDVTGVPVLEANLCICAFSVIEGGTATIGQYIWRANADSIIGLDVAVPFTHAPPELYLVGGADYDMEEATEALTSDGSGAGALQHMLAVLLVRGVQAPPIFPPGGTAEYANNLTPTLAITSKVDNSILICAVHAEFDVAGAAMTFEPPVRQHTHEEHATVTTDEFLTGSIVLKRAGTYTFAPKITGAATAAVLMVALALEPRVL